MNVFWRKTDRIPAVVVGISLLLFLTGFFNYFHQDDFIHLSYSQTFTQVVQAFNLFGKGAYPFYRPIPTQLYFFINRLIFGLNPLGYHAVNFILFAVNVFLLFQFVSLITKNKRIAAISCVFFGINSTHFAPLYTPANSQELFYVFFGLLTVYFFYEKKLVKSIIFFIFALMSKETAVILPAIIFLVLFYREKRLDFKKTGKMLALYLVVLTIYLVGHFFFYGVASGPSYKLIIGKPSLVILGWYFLWALSTPNILVDFLGSGFRLNPVFWQVAKNHAVIYFVFLPFFMFNTILAFFLFIKKYALISLGLAWFIIGLIPLMIFPLHKLATEQAFSLIGLSIALGTILSSKYHSRLRQYLAYAVLISYLFVAVNSIELAKKTHWIVRSAYQAKHVIEYIKSEYPDLASDSVLYFINGNVAIPEYGSSQQIFRSLGNGTGLSLVLKKPQLRLYFEDINPAPQQIMKNAIVIDSSKFLGY